MEILSKPYKSLKLIPPPFALPLQRAGLAHILYLPHTPPRNSPAYRELNLKSLKLIPPPLPYHCRERAWLLLGHSIHPSELGRPVFV